MAGGSLGEGRVDASLQQLDADQAEVGLVEVKRAGEGGDAVEPHEGGQHQDEAQSHNFLEPDAEIELRPLSETVKEESQPRHPEDQPSIGAYTAGEKGEGEAD